MKQKCSVSYKQYCSSSRASSEAINVASENGDQEFKVLLEEKEKEISVSLIKLHYRNRLFTGSYNQL